MRNMIIAAAVFALSVTTARAEGNLAAVETPSGAASVRSSSVLMDTGSEASPVFDVVTRETQNGPAIRDVAGESTPVFGLRSTPQHVYTAAARS